MPRFVLLDRDGVINRKIKNGYVTAWSQFVFLPEALDALRLFKTAGVLPLVVSNQAGVGKGLLPPASLNQITHRFVSRVEAAGGHIQKVYYCTHRERDRCSCRKPRPGLLLCAQREFHFNFAETYLVGDSESDLIAAGRVGCPTILVNPNPLACVKECAAPRAIVPSLKAAAEFILAG